MLHPECYIQIINKLAGKLETGPLGIAITALAPLVGSASPSAAGVAKTRSKRKARLKAQLKAPSKAETPGAGLGGGPGARARAALQADPTLSASKLAAVAGCSRSTAVSVIQAGTPRVSRPSQRARALLQKQLANGPKRVEHVEAAAEAAGSATMR